MQINATVIVQIINFWISYAMLHKLLFKPFVTLIEKKRDAKAMLVASLTSKEQAIITLQENKKQQLEDFKQYLKITYQEPHANLRDIPASATFSKHQDEIDQFTAYAKNLLIEKAPDAH